MKKLILLASIVVLFGEVYSQAEYRPIKKYKADPSYKFDNRIISKKQLGTRAGDTACSVVAFNFPLMNYIWGDLQGFNLNGNWYQSTPEVFATTLCSYIHPNNDFNKYSITQVYDTMITNVFGANSFEKIDKSKSYLQLDSLTIFGGIGVDDTNNLSSLVGDSLVISVYLTNNGVLGTKLFDSIYADTFALKRTDLIFNTGTLGSRKIRMFHKFNKGETFAIKIMYKTTKLSNGMLVSYGSVDSCGTVLYNGNNVPSPAYAPRLYPGLVRTEIVDSTSPTTATLMNSQNVFGYFGLGFPANCSYIYEQFYYIIPQLTICKELQGNIALAKERACYKDANRAYAIVSGGKPPYSFSWASTTGVISTSTTIDSVDYTMNATGGNLNVTVTDAASNSIVILKTVGNQTPIFSTFTLSPTGTILSCGETKTISVTNFSNTSFLWSTGGATNTVSINTPGTYSVTATFIPSGCKFDSSITITSSSGNSLALDFTSDPNPLCPNQDVTLSVAASATKSGWTYSWKNGSTSIGTGTSVTTNAGTSAPTITLEADSNGCKATPVTKTLTLQKVPTLTYTPVSTVTLCQNHTYKFKIANSAYKKGWDYKWTNSQNSSEGTDTAWKVAFTSTGDVTVTLTADSNGCSSTPKPVKYTVKTSGCTASINPSNLSESITIYPNPVRNGVMNIQSEVNQSAVVRVTDIMGKTVVSETIQGNKTSAIDMSGLHSGIYFVEIESKSDRMTQKVVVDRQ